MLIRFAHIVSFFTFRRKKHSVSNMRIASIRVQDFQELELVKGPGVQTLSSSYSPSSDPDASHYFISIKFDFNSYIPYVPCHPRG